MILKFLKEEKKIRGFLFVDFLLYLSTFLLTPIISIYMRDILAFNSSEIGLIIGLPSIIACFFGGISYLTYKLFIYSFTIKGKFSISFIYLYI